MTRMMLCLCLIGLFSLSIASAAEKTNTAKPNGNRLTYLDEPCNPWYPHRDFPKLTTPMWVGEEGVEAVVILGIDDMRGREKWEAYLRPILNRLKQIDGRAPVSIFSCSIDPKQPHLQQWLEEGLSLEVHTIDHPCPLLKDGDLAKAKSTVDRCIDLLNEVPNNKPVCFRMPWCDSLNTLSPRFYTEIFNKVTEGRGARGEGRGVRGEGRGARKKRWEFSARRLVGDAGLHVGRPGIAARAGAGKSPRCQLAPRPSDGPKSPEASLKLMQVKPGYRVELVAAEPLVRDPVAFDWGPDGKLWVAEMADYPLGVPDGEKNTEDTDRADQNGSNPRSSASSVFAFKI